MELSAGRFGLTRSRPAAKTALGTAGGLSLEMALGWNVEAGPSVRVGGAVDLPGPFQRASRPSLNLYSAYGRLGYRFVGAGELVPYVGAGGGWTWAEEFAAPSSDRLTRVATASRPSAQVTVGVEIGHGSLSPARPFSGARATSVA